MDRFGKHPVITSIAHLNPHNAENATIKARVTAVSAPRTYTNAKGEGQIVNVDLCDASGEIKCTVFNEHIEQFNMQVEKVYYISKVSVKAANRKFSRSEYEMSLGKNSTVEEAKESDTKGIPKMKYSFVKSIADLQNMPVNNLVGVLCFH
eukprot:TRINITY_DN3636_c0_g2_i6.p1 TRINITY_DN3636_c0_g2~~TRINITY_DN3636_c0_g2_i6.p1  ORF type:complete len:150 (-),score=28.79 TRINITY_DN3636_c0_g2_i6:331-780(-)